MGLITDLLLKLCRRAFRDGNVPAAAVAAIEQGLDRGVLATKRKNQFFSDQIEQLNATDFQAHFLHSCRAPSFLLPAVTPTRLHNADLIVTGRFVLIGETYELPAGFSWRQNPSPDKEWQIAQHKHSFAVDLALAYRESNNPAYLQCWATLMSSWLAEMGSGYITASDAQVEAKRVEHWTIALLLLTGTPAANHLPPGLLAALLRRLAEEAWYILAHLKPARNHRTFQLYSVFLAGVLFPELREARQLMVESALLMTNNLLTDILPDGVQVELSTHYHQLVMETATTFIALARWCGLALDPALNTVLERGLTFSFWMQRPDGSIPLIGDSDEGDHLPLLMLGADLLNSPELRWAATLGQAGTPPDTQAKYFEDAGYFVLGDGWGSDPASFAQRQHIFYDCGQLGVGSHSHYDLFNFTYYAAGVPLVVDPGRYTYNAAPAPDGLDWRQQFKSTAYHNTVTIDGLDQTRYISKWQRDRAGGSHSGMKHGPAPEILDRRWFLGQQSDWVDAQARSTEYAPLHRRFFLYMRCQYLLIVDQVRIDDGHTHSCDLRFHLDPLWLNQVTLAGDAETIIAHTPSFQVWVSRVPNLDGRVETGWVSAHYGIKEPAPVLSFRQCNAGTVTFCSLVAPVGAMEVVRLQTQCEQDEGQLRCTVAGQIAGQPIVDEVFIALGKASVTVAEAGLCFRGRHLVLRRSHTGQITYLCAHGVEQLHWDGAPDELHLKEDVEWWQ